MSSPLSITLCTQDDYLEIIRDLSDFWGSERTIAFHHPMFVAEFGQTAFVIRDQGKVIAYLFGFLSPRDPVGYVHLSAVRKAYQGKGLGTSLYEHFIAVAKAEGCSRLKAITTPGNKLSIAFHTTLGMTLSGQPNAEGIPVVKDYAGAGQDRVVFEMDIG